MPTQNLYAVKDAHVAQHSYGNWYIYQAGRAQNLWLGCWDWANYSGYWGFYAYQSRVLMQFAMPSLGAEDSLISAKLKVPLGTGQGLQNPNNASYHTKPVNQTIDIHRITQAWDEGTGDGQSDYSQYSGVTWTNRTASGYGWDAYGGSYDGNIVASSTQNVNTYMWEFDVTNLVRSWMADPASNLGIMIKYRNESPSGSHYMWSKDMPGVQWGPYIEFTYNSAPEKPRGLAPNFGGFVCQDLAHTMEFKWTFIDTAAPISRGKANICFLIDVSGSMSGTIPQVRRQINTYIDRLNAEGVDWQISFVSYSDVRLGEPINKYGWYTNKNDALFAFDRIPQYGGGDYPESGLEAILDYSNGARSFTWRPNSERQLVICGDAPFHNRSGVDTYYPNYSSYEIADATNWLNSMGIKTSAATNTHCGSYTQLRQFPNSTGGQYLDISSNWGDYLNILTYKTADEAARFDEGDYQTRADLRIFKNNNGTKTHIWSYTVNSAAQVLFVKGLGVPWEEGAAYEWDVMVYDRYGVASPWSDRAAFSYIIDVNAAIGIPMFKEAIKIGDTINRRAFDEIKEKLYYEVRKYSNLDPGITDGLFLTEVIPTASDFNKIESALNGILVSDGLPKLTTPLVGDSLGVSDIQYIRNQITTASMSPPDNPTVGVARKKTGYLRAPVAIVAKNANTSDFSIDITWSNAEAMGSGWLVNLVPVKDTDINYYKFYREETMNLTNKAKKILTETYLTTEQVQGGPIFVPDTGRVDGESMMYLPHDMNGRTSPLQGQVSLDRTLTIGNPFLWYYIVQYQQRHWSAVEADPNGLWYSIYSGGTGLSMTHTVGSEGSYWYRVCAVDGTGTITGWTYTQNRVYVRT